MEGALLSNSMPVDAQTAPSVVMQGSISCMERGLRNQHSGFPLIDRGFVCLCKLII